MPYASSQNRPLIFSNQLRNRSEEVRRRGQNPASRVRQFLPRQLLHTELRPRPRAPRVPPGMGKGLPPEAQRIGQREAGDLVRRPERRPPRNRPEEPEDERPDGRIHAPGAAVLHGPFGRRLFRLVSRSVPGESGRLHLLELHEELEGRQYWLASRLLRVERASEGHFGG